MSLTRTGRTWCIYLFAEQEFALTPRQTDIDDRHLPTEIRSRADDMADLEGVEGYGAGGPQDRSGYRTTGGFEAAGNIDGQHRGIEGHPRDHLCGKSSPKADAEQGIDDEIRS
jgi:hypothetical protein